MAARRVGAAPTPAGARSMAAPVLESLGHAVVASDPQGVVFLWNRAAEQLYGWTAAEAIGRPVTELTIPGATRWFAAEIRRELDAGRTWSGVFTARRKDGSTFSALVTDTVLRDEEGCPVAVVCASVNVGDVLRPLLQRTHEAGMVADAEGVVRLASPVITSLTGWPDGELVGQSWWRYVHPDDQPAARAAHAGTVAGDGPVPPVEHRVRCADGSWLWVETSEANLLDEPAVRGVLLTLRDVTERRAWLAELTRRALHDALTGLANRAVFMERLASHVAARRHEGAVLYLDLDGFKRVNDRFGHHVGDEVLRQVAERLRASVRPEDVCGRLGGDELAVLAPSVATRQQAAALARRIRTAVARPIPVGDTTLQQTVSIGVAMLTDLRDADRALRLADTHMYARKRAAVRQQDAVPLEDR